MLPLTLLRSAQGQEILVELKNGETYNGHLVNIDTWMNLNLRNVTRTGKDGDRFWCIEELYVRGNTVKYMRVPDKVIDIAAENVRNSGNRNRGSGRGRGRGRGSGRGGGRGAGRGAGRGGRGRHSRDARDGRPYQNQHSRYDSD